MEGTSSLEVCKILNRVIFHEFEFRGEKEDFYNPDNSFLGKVLDNRRGIPLTLSVVYLLVADRFGFQLEPVGFPVRFMLGCFEEEVPFYIDPFSEALCFLVVMSKLSSGKTKPLLWIPIFSLRRSARSSVEVAETSCISTNLLTTPR